MKIKSGPLGLLIIVFVIIGISVSIATNYWATESSKVPQKLESGEGYDPSDIRGSYSFSDVSTSFDISLDTLKYAFSIPDSYDIASFQNKTLEELYSSTDSDIEVGNGSVKMFVALYKNLPYDYISAGDYLPLKAYELLEEQGLIPESNREYILNHTVNLSVFKGENSPTSSEEIIHEENKVNRNTTFKELLNLGLSKESIEEIIGGTYDSDLETVSNYCESNDLQFGEIKTELQNLINSLIE